MRGRQTALLLAALGVAVLLSTWGSLSEWTESLLQQDTLRRRQVVYWTNSGSPEVDLKRSREFMRLYPDTRVTPNFRETGGLDDIIFVSFLSGNPPDYLSVKVNELRKYVLMGGVRPLDDLLAREGRDYFERYLMGEARVYRFRVSPDDRFFETTADGAFRHPLEAARLLAMHGRAVGLRDIDMPSTLTYNKRLFREAARMFPDAGLLDAAGEPAAPRTWLAFYRVARTIAEYGRRVAEQRGLPEPYCYGAVFQGERQHDLMRGIRPLAQRAGSMAFAFQGDTHTVRRGFGTGTEAGRRAAGRFADRPIGYFDYDNPAFLAAFALIYRMRQDDLVLPGMESRHYEDVRTALASGRAAMVVDGWHAALIGAERVPWAAQDLGSAPLPVPYLEPDPAAGRTAGQVAAEKRELYALLSLDRAGIELGPGNRQPRMAGERVTFFTSLCRHPEATWQWIHFVSSDEAMMKTECRRGIVREERMAMAHMGDPEWFPYPYQKQVYGILANHCAMWPERPLHGPVRPATEQEVFYKYFYQTETRDLAEILPRARAELGTFTEAANRDLARRVEEGIAQPADWTFPDWDPARAEVFFNRQQGGGADPALDAQLDAIRARLVAWARRRPELQLLDAAGRLREDVWAFRPPRAAAQLAWIPVLLLAVVLAWFTALGIRNARANEPVLRDAMLQARRHWHGYVFALPGLLTIFAFAIYPSFYQFYLAAHRGDGLGTMQFVGWANFARVFAVGSPDFDHAFWNRVMPNTLIFMAATTAGQITIGLFLASLLNMPLKANRAYRVLFFIPLVTSLAIVSVILIGLLKGESSGLNELLSRTGLRNLPYWLGLVEEPGKPLNWLGEKTGLGTVIAVSIWHGMPYNIILLLAGLQSISPDLYEAGKVDGATAWQRFCHITVPELMPILIVIAFQAFISSARAFSVVFVLTEGGINHSSELAASYIFKWGFMRPEGREADLGYASALGIAYSLMLMALTAANVTIVARRWKRRLAPK